MRLAPATFCVRLRLFVGELKKPQNHPFSQAVETLDSAASRRTFGGSAFNSSSIASSITFTGQLLDGFRVALVALDKQFIVKGADDEGVFEDAQLSVEATHRQLQPVGGGALDGHVDSLVARSDAVATAPGERLAVRAAAVFYLRLCGFVVLGDGRIQIKKRPMRSFDSSGAISTP